MSVPHLAYVLSHPAWLQPVRYDLNGFREFARSLDAGLAELETKHAPRRCFSAERAATACPLSLDQSNSGFQGNT